MALEDDALVPASCGAAAWALELAAAAAAAARCSARVRGSRSKADGPRGAELLADDAPRARTPAADACGEAVARTSDATEPADAADAALLAAAAPPADPTDPALASNNDQ